MKKRVMYDGKQRHHFFLCFMGSICWLLLCMNGETCLLLTRAENDNKRNWYTTLPILQPKWLRYQKRTKVCSAICFLWSLLPTMETNE
jgi:hypothetical protein